MEVTIDTAHEGVDAVCARLAALDIESLSILDGEEFEAILGENETAWELVDEALRGQLSGVCRVSFYLPSDEQGRQKLAEVKAGLRALRIACPGIPFGPFSLRVSNVREEDWADNWKQYYKPIPIGRRLLIQPAWEEIENAEGRAVFLNNPGMSFGTGEHETTRLCLEALERRIQGGEKLLDVGCGSGILSICALLLGAEEADAVDVDPHAVDAARKNAALNELESPQYRPQAGNPLEKNMRLFPPYDMVVANIVADVIIELCPLAAELLADGGVFVASGVIEKYGPAVAEALEKAGFEIEEARARRGWLCFAARKK